MPSTYWRLQAMPFFSVHRSQEGILTCPDFAPRQEPCILITEQGNDLIECCTWYREQVSPTPPSSPKDTPLTCTESDEAYPSTSCALLFVDQKIQAHQANLPPIQHGNPLGSYSPAYDNGSVSGMKLVCFDEAMHRMTPLRQVSSASDDDDMTVMNSRCPSSRSSGAITLVNELSIDNREVKAHGIATNDHNQRKIALSPRAAIQHSSPQSPTSKLFGLRSSREAIANAQNRLRAPSESNDTSQPRNPATGGQISSPTPIGSSAIPDIAALPLECKQSKTKSWPGPCSQLPRPDTVSMARATERSKSRKSDFACFSRRERKARCDGGISSCGKCPSSSETCSFNIYGSSLQPLEEHKRGEDAAVEQQAATMEQEHSHFSNYSTDEDDDDERVPSRVRLASSLSRLNQKSKTRLSWSSLFSRP